MSSTVCPVDLDIQALRAEIQQMYARVASEPDGDFHFHRGPRYATEFLGYDAGELEKIPQQSTESFAGVGNPLAMGAIPEGGTVLDIGSGAGMDLLLAATQAGPSGRAIGVDMTPEMMAKCRTSAQSMGLDHVEVLEGDIHRLPVDDESVDVVISNGVLNLAQNKLQAYGEILRVLKPGGRLQLADIVVEGELSEKIRGNYELWAA